MEKCVPVIVVLMIGLATCHGTGEGLQPTSTYDDMQVTSAVIGVTTDNSTNISSTVAPPDQTDKGYDVSTDNTNISSTHDWSSLEDYVTSTIGSTKSTTIGATENTTITTNATDSSVTNSTALASQLSSVNSSPGETFGTSPTDTDVESATSTTEKEPLHDSGHGKSLALGICIPLLIVIVAIGAWCIYRRQRRINRATGVRYLTLGEETQFGNRENPTYDLEL